MALTASIAFPAVQFALSEDQRQFDIKFWIMFIVTFVGALATVVGLIGSITNV
jgi:hypothetical protein